MYRKAKNTIKKPLKTCPRKATEDHGLRAQGPSPDEVALVEGGRQLGFEFVKRVKDGCVLRLAGVEAQFEVLNVMEYSSARSRMSVVARAPSGAIRLYCKGADTKARARACVPPHAARVQGFQGFRSFGDPLFKWGLPGSSRARPRAPSASA